MGCDRFCQDTTIPCLETVCEEARRQNGTVFPISHCITLLVFSLIFQLFDHVQIMVIYPIITSVTFRLSIHHPRVAIQQIMMHCVWGQIDNNIIIIIIKVPPITLHFICNTIIQPCRAQRRWPISRMPSIVLKI